MREAHGQTVSLQEYLEREERNARKHEFVKGDVYAMAGATRRHDLITGNVFASLRAASRGTPCRTHTSDMKVRAGDDVVYYPDVSVDCASGDQSDSTIERPCFVVEVTSRHTARTDRGEKLENYRRTASLRMYLIVDQSRRRVTCHRRVQSGEWTMEELQDRGTIRIPCPATQLTLDEIYEGVELPPLGVAESEEEEYEFD